MAGIAPRSAEARHAVALLESALGSALDNLPDVVNDPMFGPEDVAACCMDIACMQYLLAEDKSGQSNIAAYL